MPLDQVLEYGVEASEVARNVEPPNRHRSGHLRGQSALRSGRVQANQGIGELGLVRQSDDRVRKIARRHVACNVSAERRSRRATPPATGNS